jgi:hypothetical protein
MALENTSMIPSPARVLGERIQSLDELANIALSSPSSSSSSLTPKKRKRIGPTNHGRVCTVAACGRFPHPIFLINHVTLSLFSPASHSVNFCHR